MKLYVDIESVIDIMARASIVRSVEAIVEGWISILELHSSKTRGLGQTTMEDEMWIAINGPEVVYCDSVVLEALKLYWEKSKLAGNRDGHYIRRSQNIKDWFISKAVDSLKKKSPKIPFMA